ncbi:hypothetical protein [Carnobacterium maltaromaticum]|uniref:hypothetical protein n=1 Tax=Carnobacterium maltaromaticum TaxID=2751 RepID=UPI00295EF51C|nr:hypothetical protein [Carnobacterium maltaromaticum]
MSKVTLSIPEVKKNRVTVFLTVSPECKNLFTTTEFFIDYTENIESIPPSILMVPFLYNLIPISWFKDIELVVPVLDKKTFESLEILKENMSIIHGNIELGGKLKIGNIEDNTSGNEVYKKAMLFSGGVDSWSSFLSHYEELPYLCTVWGADIKLNDTNGWNRVKKNTLEVCKQFNTEAFFVKTNFRDILNYFNLEQGLEDILTGNWWHDVQHGMGLTSLFAPLMYKYHVELLYVPGTFSSQWLEPIASEPRIDNYIKFGSSSVYHDQFEKNRQEKLVVIKKYYERTQQKFTIRVCYEGTGGENCCICEKCNRTIIGLMVLGLNAENFGFTRINIKRMKKLISNNSWVYSKARLLSFQDIQQMIDSKYLDTDINKDFIQWFSNVDFDECFRKNQVSKFNKFKRTSKKLVKKVLK